MSEKTLKGEKPNCREIKVIMKTLENAHTIFIPKPTKILETIRRII